MRQAGVHRTHEWWQVAVSSAPEVLYLIRRDVVRVLVLWPGMLRVECCVSVDAVLGRSASLIQR